MNACIMLPNNVSLLYMNISSLTCVTICQIFFEKQHNFINAYYVSANEGVQAQSSRAIRSYAHDRYKSLRLAERFSTRN